MCFGPSTQGAGAKTRLKSRIKKFTPHCVCRSLNPHTDEQCILVVQLHGHKRWKLWKRPYVWLPTRVRHICNVFTMVARVTPDKLNTHVCASYAS